jgi:hypothetical protein
MGQAFDKDGKLLGEADGDTRGEVLRKLEQAHADAAKIEITRRLKELEKGTTAPRIEDELFYKGG